MSDEAKKKTGPPPKTLKIEQPWEDAVAHALNKKRPADGWPEADAPKKRPKKKEKPA